MGICLFSGATSKLIAATSFTLAWTHSVERTEWQEDWRLIGNRLEIVQARIKGSGAGMEPPDDARLIGGWWVYRPAVSVDEINLANAGGRAGRWRICTDGQCRAIAERLAPDVPLIIRRCHEG